MDRIANNTEVCVQEKLARGVSTRQEEYNMVASPWSVGQQDRRAGLI